MDFSGRRALVTGAAGGIGASVVARLRGDLLDGLYADGLTLAASKALGGLDIVVNNAGVITRGAVTETSEADWSLSVGVNVEAPFRICRAAIPLMAGAGGGHPLQCGRAGLDRYRSQ